MMSPKDFEAKQILFLVTKEGQSLSFRNDNVVITDKNKKVIHQSTCYRLFAVFVVGHISITSGLIQRAKKFGFAIVLMTPSFRMYQIISSSAEANVLLRKKQYEYDEIFAARALVANKIENQRYNLMQIRDKRETVREAVKLIDASLVTLESADTIQSIMGVEGSASRVYFKAYFDNVTWKGRKPRIKPDMTNALLDIGYTILFSFIDALLALYGFDRYWGILHRQFYMRKSLVCDMVEPFRVIIDKQVKKGVNLGQFKERDFQVYDGKWCLKYEKSSEYSSIFLSALLSRKEEIFIYIRDFYRKTMKGKLSEEFPEWNEG